MKHKRLAVMLFVLGLFFVLGMGCGRKLPPLPPGPADPVELVSAEFLEDGTVEARARANIEGARIILLGKAKGLCPLCTDDLKKKDEKVVENKGIVVLKDLKPESDYMVYRFAFEKGTLSFMTGARIVRK